MRLVRYLIVLIVLLSTSAWAAPTQPELPGAWVRAALHTCLQASATSRC
ncbi:putative secreted protein [Xanthomonas campestris pv. raphani 756C]|nr:putative secreted protein [Xanthomonas campestris pv. raphani 756C]